MIDPIQSVRGKVVMDAFRLIPKQVLMMGTAPRESTSNLGFLRKPSIQACMRGLNRMYYSLNISTDKCSHLEDIKILRGLRRGIWSDALTVSDSKQVTTDHQKLLEQTLAATKAWNLRLKEEDRLQDEEHKSDEEIALSLTGKLDPKAQLEQASESLAHSSILHTLDTMLASVVF